MKDGSDFVQPPWVYSPSEVMSWINATNPPHKLRKFKAEKGKKKRCLKNIEIELDLDVEREKIDSSVFLISKIRELTGFEKVEEHFELLPTAELMLRALAKAKFHNVVKIVLDGKTLYENPEKGHDTMECINLLSEIANRTKEGKNIRLRVKKKEDCLCDIMIQRIHPRKRHTVEIKFKGELEEEYFHRFLNYLKNNLSIRDIKTSENN
ncbi:MAG: hypothetical protein DRJ99_03350 [Thermoplasmata archaeon]|nr:MAG: hypothetical protein DRJ99_03350 [Thermoplasmata archaeon]